STILPFALNDALPIFVTGASGEGKSTTLASMAQTIANRRSVNIVSIEDPIEFVHKQGRSLVNQREIGSDALVHQASPLLVNKFRSEEHTSELQSRGHL